MHKWSDFQSLIQISITLNVAYFSLSQFVEPTKVRETVNLKQTFETIRDMNVNGVMTEAEYHRLRAEVADLRDRFDAIVVRDPHVVSYVGRMAVVLFFIGMMLLVKASFNPEQRINPFNEVCCAVLPLPVIGGVFLLAVINTIRYRSVITIRRSIDDRIQLLNEGVE